MDARSIVEYNKHNNSIRRRVKSTLPCFLLLCLLASGCRNDMEQVHFFDQKEMPQQQLDSVTVIRSTNGRLQMLLTAPEVVVYEKPEKKTDYPQGVWMRLYDKGDELVADVKAGYAYSLDDKKIIEARHHVVIIDYRSGDTSYMEHIVWNSAEGRIYSNDPVRSVNGPRVTIGDGFESDENFTSPQMLHQRGTIQFDE